MTKPDRAASLGAEAEPYTSPALTVLGTVVELTKGHPGTGSDGINPGSLIPR